MRRRTVAPPTAQRAARTVALDRDAADKQAQYGTAPNPTADNAR